MGGLSVLELFIYLDIFIVGILITIAAQHAYTHYFGSDSEDSTDSDTLSLPKDTKEELFKKSKTQFTDVLTGAADTLQHDLKTTADRITLHFEELANKTVHDETKKYKQELATLHDSAAETVGAVNEATAKYGSELKGTLGQVHAQAEQSISDSTDEINRFQAEQQKQLAELQTAAQTAIESASQQLLAFQQALTNKIETLHQQADGAIEDVTADITNYKKELKAELAERIKKEEAHIAELIDAKAADALSSFLVETLQHNVDLGAQNEYIMTTLEEHKQELMEGLGGEADSSK